MKVGPRRRWGIGVAVDMSEWPKLGSRKRAANDRNWVDYLEGSTTKAII